MNQAHKYPLIAPFGRAIVYRMGWRWWKMKEGLFWGSGRSILLSDTDVNFTFSGGPPLHVKYSRVFDRDVIIQDNAIRVCQPCDSGKGCNPILFYRSLPVRWRMKTKYLYYSG